MEPGTEICFATPHSSSDVSALVSFPGGVPQTCLTSSMRLHAFGKSSGKKRKIVVDGDAAGIKFRGTCNSSNDLGGISLGLLDEVTGILDLQPLDETFIMQQLTSCNDNPPSFAATCLNTMERRQSVTDTFGSKKKKRAMRSAESNVISAQNIVASDTVSEMLTESMMDNSSMHAEDSQSASKTAIMQHREIMLPPFDVYATDLDKAYPLVGGLIPSAMVHVLASWVDSRCNEMNSGDICGCWRSILSQHITSLTVHTIGNNDNIRQVEDSKEMKKYVGNLLLCDVMIRLAVALLGTAKPISKDTLQEKISCPPALLRHLTDNFAVYKKSFGKGAFMSTKSLM